MSAARAAVVALLSGVAASTATALPTWVARVANTGQPAPGVAGANFTSFNIAPSQTAGFTYFGGRWGSGSGLLRYNGVTLSSLVTNDTLTPGGATSFDSFTSVTASGLRFAFNADFDGFDGAFLSSASTGLISIADTKPISDSGSRLFETVGMPSVDGDVVSVWAFTPNSSVSNEGIFQTTNRITEQNRIVRLGQSLPGSTQIFTDFGPNPVNGGGASLFWGKSSSNQGLYLSTGGGLVSVFADNNSFIPGQTSPLTGIRQNFSYDGTFAAFIGSGNFGVPTIYLGVQGGSIVSVASLFDPIPGGFGTFSDFQDVAVSGDRVVFTATGPQSQQGLYAWINGEIITLVDRASDLEDEKSVSRVRIGRESFDGDIIAFIAEFTDGSSGVYTFDLATFPSPGALVAMPLAGLIAMRRRR
ncbi:MAG: hypothetical protein ACF8QF_14755 [Phycisphaerales bacterium]